MSNDRYRDPKQRYAGGLTLRQFFGIACLFWVYVTLSNVLYAYSMRTGIAHVTNVSLFAPWDARVLQHVLLLPFLLVSYWASLRIQWRPLLLALPLQFILGVVFAALAYPAMIVAQMTLGAPDWHEHDDGASGGRILLSVAVARELREFPAHLRLRPRAHHRAGALHAISRFRIAASPRSSASGARRAWRRCACSYRRTRCSICCTRFAAISNGTRRARRPWSCSSRICCAGCLNAGRAAILAARR